MRTLPVVVVVAALFFQHTSGLHFVGLGDWGDERPSGITEQKAVAQALSEWCGSHDCSFIQDTGDNFYPAGVTSATDPRFDTSWRWIYNLTNIEDKEWYISLGNHDHGLDDGREQFQVQFGLTEPRWYFPSLWYDAHYTDGVTKLHLIVLDSQSLRQNKNDPAAQLAWLETTLAGSTSDDWKIVITHHPPYSTGSQGPDDITMVNDVLPLCQQYGVDIWLSGHEHNLEHLAPTIDREIDYFITGGGGRELSPYDPANEAYLNNIGIQVDYFGYLYGFVAFDFTPTTYTANFVDKAGTVVNFYSRSK